MEDTEVVVMGDNNLDFLKWTKPDLPPNDSSLKIEASDRSTFLQNLPTRST